MKKAKNKSRIWLWRLGPVGLCRTQDMEELQNQMTEKELMAINLLEKNAKLQNENQIFHEKIGKLRKQVQKNERQVEVLLEEKAALQRENQLAYKRSIAKFKNLLWQAKEINPIKMADIDFPISENPETGKWYVSMNICSLGGCEFNDLEFSTQREAMEFGYILTQLGEKVDTSCACSECYSEYLRECV